MKDEELIWEEISTEHIVQDEWIDFRRSAYRYPDGTVWPPDAMPVCVISLN